MRRRQLSGVIRLWNDSRGIASTEYAVLIGTVALGSAAAFIAVGVAFVRNFDLVRNLVLTPFP